MKSLKKNRWPIEKIERKKWKLSMNEWCAHSTISNEIGDIENGSDVWRFCILTTVLDSRKAQQHPVSQSTFTHYHSYIWFEAWFNGLCNTMNMRIGPVCVCVCVNCSIRQKKKKFICIEFHGRACKIFHRLFRLTLSNWCSCIQQLEPKILFIVTNVRDVAMPTHSTHIHTQKHHIDYGKWLMNNASAQLVGEFFMQLF